jgi:hypothetical protein
VKVPFLGLDVDLHFSCSEHPESGTMLQGHAATRPDASRRSRPVCGMEVSVGAGRADASVVYARGRSGEGRPSRALA